jgi:hypothetical protein
MASDAETKPTKVFKEATAVAVINLCDPHANEMTFLLVEPFMADGCGVNHYRPLGELQHYPQRTAFLNEAVFAD